MFKSALLPALAAGLVAAWAAGAAAEPLNPITVQGHVAGDLKVQSKTVHFEDLDVNSPDGARILFHRINLAAEDVCTPAAPMDVHGIAELKDAQDFQTCKADAIDLALADVNSPALSTYRVAYR